MVVVQDPALQYQLATEAIKRALSVRDFEKMVKKAVMPQQKTVAPQQSIELKDMVNRMQRVFATKVTVLGNDNKGRIYIDYYNRDDLDRISSILSSLEK